MIKFTLIFLVFSLNLFGNSFAQDNSLFQYDAKALSEEFENLDQLESFLNQPSNQFSYTDLQEKEPQLLEELQLQNLNTANPIGTNFELNDIDWGAFAWGFCCCPIGLFTIALSNEKDPYQKSSYWIGLGTGVVVGGGGCLVYILLVQL